MENSSDSIEDQELIKFPLLGTLEDGEPFEYLILSIDKEFIEISILDWFINRVKLHKGDKVELYIPQVVREKFHLRDRAVDVVISEKHNKGMKGELYRISTTKNNSLDGVKGYSLSDFTLQHPLALCEKDLLFYLIKDSLILKLGIRVYIRHIMTYFSRIVNYSSNDYDNLKKYFFADVLQHVQDKIDKLEKLFETVVAKIKKMEEIPIYIDLEELREILESEISLNLFHVMFSGKKQPNLKEYFTTDKNFGFAMYINAIKNLEKRLYSNYNQIVLIYVRSLT